MDAKELSLWLEENFPKTKKDGRRHNTIQGIAVNDANYKTAPRINGKNTVCPAYQTWLNMVKRCYSERSLLVQPAYMTTTVSKEWLTFSSFRKWWLENWKEGWCLDKDLLSASKVYSPETCIFVPEWLNTFTTLREADRGQWPVGVSKKGNKFAAHCNNGKERIYLGAFETPEEAHEKWMQKKIELLQEKKADIDAIDGRIFSRILEIIHESV